MLAGSNERLLTALVVSRKVNRILSNPGGGLDAVISSERVCGCIGSHTTHAINSMRGGVLHCMTSLEQKESQEPSRVVVPNYP